MYSYSVMFKQSVSKFQPHTVVHLSILGILTGSAHLRADLEGHYVISPLVALRVMCQGGNIPPPFQANNDFNISPSPKYNLTNLTNINNLKVTGMQVSK